MSLQRRLLACLALLIVITAIVVPPVIVHVLNANASTPATGAPTPGTKSPTPAQAPPTPAPTPAGTSSAIPLSVSSVTDKIYPDDTVGSGTTTFGSSLVVSGDGSTIACAAPFDDLSVGGVWIYRNNGTVLQKLVPSEADAQVFGNRLAISFDGSTIALSGRTNGNVEGGVWVYVRVANGTWVEQSVGPLLGPAPSPTDPLFGDSIALSGDGDTLLVGADGLGAVLVFVREAGTWSQQGTAIMPQDQTPDDGFGWSLAMNFDGTRFVVANGRNDPDGRAWTFTLNNGQYEEVGTPLTGPNYFGDSICMDNSGDSLIIGGDTSSGEDGSFATYAWNGAGWDAGESALTITGSQKVGSSYCSMTAEGSYFYAGFTAGDTNLPSFAIFERTSTLTWSLHSTVSAPLEMTLPQPSTVQVSTSANGTIIAISTSRPNGDNSGADSGLWIYTMGD
jgi:hypothetical protein